MAAEGHDLYPFNSQSGQTEKELVPTATVVLNDMDGCRVELSETAGIMEVTLTITSRFLDELSPGSLQKLLPVLQGVIEVLNQPRLAESTLGELLKIKGEAKKTGFRCKRNINGTKFIINLVKELPVERTKTTFASLYSALIDAQSQRPTPAIPINIPLNSGGEGDDFYTSMNVSPAPTDYSIISEMGSPTLNSQSWYDITPAFSYQPGEIAERYKDQQLLIDYIHDHLADSEKRSFFIIAGANYVGKGAVIEQYIEKYRKYYDNHIIIIPSEDNIIKSVRDVISRLFHYDCDDLPDEEIANQFQKLLRINEDKIGNKLLFVFRQATEQAMIAPFIPKIRGVDILITSTNKQWPHETECLKPLTHDGASKYLQNYPWKNKPDDLDAECDKLVALCEGLPYPLSIAAKCLESGGLVRDFISRFSNEMARMITAGKTWSTTKNWLMSKVYIEDKLLSIADDSSGLLEFIYTFALIKQPMRCNIFDKLLSLYIDEEYLDDAKNLLVQGCSLIQLDCSGCYYLFNAERKVINKEFKQKGDVEITDIITKALSYFDQLFDYDMSRKVSDDYYLVYLHVAALLEQADQLQQTKCVEFSLEIIKTIISLKERLALFYVYELEQFSEAYKLLCSLNPQTNSVPEELKDQQIEAALNASDSLVRQCPSPSGRARAKSLFDQSTTESHRRNSFDGIVKKRNRVWKEITILNHGGYKKIHLETNYDEAYSKYKDALQRLEVIKDMDENSGTLEKSIGKIQREKAMIHRYIGEIYHKRGSYDAALNEYTIAEGIYDDLKLPYAIIPRAILQVNRGLVSLEQSDGYDSDKLEEAEEYILSALRIFNKFGIKQHLKYAEACIHLALTNCHQKNIKKAKIRAREANVVLGILEDSDRYYNRGEDICKNRYHLYVILNHVLARIACLEGNPKKAEQYLATAETFQGGLYPDETHPAIIETKKSKALALWHDSSSKNESLHHLKMALTVSANTAVAPIVSLNVNSSHEETIQFINNIAIALTLITMYQSLGFNTEASKVIQNLSEKLRGRRIPAAAMRRSNSDFSVFGIGLNCDNIVEQHHNGMGDYSDSDESTSFFVTPPNTPTNLGKDQLATGGGDNGNKNESDFSVFRGDGIFSRNDLEAAAFDSMIADNQALESKQPKCNLLRSWCSIL